MTNKKLARETCTVVLVEYLEGFVPAIQTIETQHLRESSS